MPYKLRNTYKRIKETYYAQKDVSIFTERTNLLCGYS